MASTVQLAQKALNLRDGGLAWGATNSGKSFGLTDLFANRACRYRRRHLLIGANLKLLRGEVIPLIRQHAHRHGFPSTHYRTDVGSFKVGRSEVIVVAGAKAGDEDRLRTYHNIDSILAEEVSAMPEDFFDMALTRQRQPPGPVWANCNPTEPINWVKKRLDDGRWPHSERFFVDDNPTLTDEQIRAFSAQFSGTFKKRMIDAEWTTAEGLIYPGWTDSNFYARGQGCWIGADYGESSVTVALYVQRNDDGQFVVTDEYHWNNYHQTERNADGHAVQVRRQAPGSIHHAWPDPSALDLIAAFRRARINTSPAWNDRHGYNITDGMLQRKQLLINKDRCPNLYAGILSLKWNRHGDSPDPNCVDHDTDALRYVAVGLSDILGATYDRGRFR